MSCIKFLTSPPPLGRGMISIPFGKLSGGEVRREENGGKGKKKEKKGNNKKDNDKNRGMVSQRSEV